VQPAEDALKIGEAGDSHRVVDWASKRLAEESSDRGRNSGDGPYAAGNFFDVNARITS
jgi:hypothetical protein